MRERASLLLGVVPSDERTWGNAVDRERSGVGAGSGCQRHIQRPAGDGE
jgi:hypothetical protein